MVDPTNHFSRLPREVRGIIYDFLYHMDGYISLAYPEDPQPTRIPGLALLRVSKLIASEATGIIRAVNRCKVNDRRARAGVLALRQAMKFRDVHIDLNVSDWLTMGHREPWAEGDGSMTSTLRRIGNLLNQRSLEQPNPPPIIVHIHFHDISSFSARYLRYPELGPLDSRQRFMKFIKYDWEERMFRGIPDAGSIQRRVFFLLANLQHEMEGLRNQVTGLSNLELTSNVDWTPHGVELEYISNNKVLYRHEVRREKGMLSGVSGEQGAVQFVEQPYNEEKAVAKATV